MPPRYIKFAELLFTLLFLATLLMLFIFFNDSSSSLLKYNSSGLAVSLLSLSMYLTLFLSIEYIVSASILAIAIIDFFFPNLLTMLRYLDLNFFVYFINECTVSTKKNLNIDGPCFVICPFIILSPEEYSLGIKPVYDANLSLFLNLEISPISEYIQHAE